MSDGVSRRPDTVVLVGGGIGAGKSSVLSVFADRGFTTVSADEVGREILAPGSPLVDEVAAAWPGVVADGVVDRQALAAIVFTDPAALERLEAITHPEIERRIRRTVAASTAPVAIEVPVMKVFTTDAFTRLAVVADPEVRIARAVARGGSREDVQRRLANQPTDHEWRRWADLVVDNSGAWAQTEQTVRTLIEDLVADG